MAHALLPRRREDPALSREPRRPTIRHDIDDPFEFSEYEGDVNDRRVEFWCKKCNCRAIVDIDPRDGEVEAIRCPKAGADHFHVAYLPLDDDLPDLEDDDFWEELAAIHTEGGAVGVTSAMTGIASVRRADGALHF
jgi:hypothetical protein